jgi:hypothetical protein
MKRGKGRIVYCVYLEAVCRVKEGELNEENEGSHLDDTTQ